MLATSRVVCWFVSDVTALWLGLNNEKREFPALPWGKPCRVVLNR